MAGGSVDFAGARSLRVQVFDRVGRTQQIKEVLSGFEALLRTVAAAQLTGLSFERGRFPKVGAS